MQNVNQFVTVARWKIVASVVPVLAWLAWGGSNLHAQSSFQLNVTVNATAAIQGADDGGDPIDTAKPPTTLKITTAWLIQQIATLNDNAPVPKGALLKQTGGVFIVTDSKGNDQGWDASSLTMDDSDNTGDPSIWQGQRNFETSKYTTSYQSILRLTYDDGNGTTFSISGVEKGVYNSSSIDADGNQTLTDTRTTSNGYGSGTINGATAIISGAKITASFKGKLATQ